MTMGFGGSSPPPPEPIPQVPQEDHPNSLEIEKQAIRKSKAQDGVSKHLLSPAGGAPAKVKQAKLIG